MAPRILVIAYDFPPHGAIGTMRTLRLVRQLHHEGWRVTVLTGSPATYLPGTPVERGLEAHVPAGVEVLQVRAVRPFHALERLIARLRSRRSSPGAPASTRSPQTPPRGALTTQQRSWVRRVSGARDLIEAALDIPDKESGWIVPAVARGASHMLRAGRPHVIYSSAPPWSGQVVALWLARLSGRPWVADFRDPWARAPWREWRRAFRQRAAAAFEGRVVRRADSVIFATRANMAEFSHTYGPSAARRFVVIPNGCDPAEFASVTPIRREQFVLLHAGTLYGARSPLPVMRAIAAALNRRTLAIDRFRLRLLGPISLEADPSEECRRLGIEEIVEFAPRVTRAESLQEMISASALLLIQTGTTVSVPGKAYEYLAAGRPVLALVEEGETAELIRASGIGVSVSPHDPVETIESALLKVMAIAERDYARPTPELYDGNAHASTAANLLLSYARRGRRPLAMIATAVAAGSRVAPGKEPPR